MMAIFWCATLTAQDRTDWVITHVNVIQMDREVILENRTVVIRDGRIAEIAPADENPLDDLSTLRAPYGVMILGRWHDRARLESLFPQ